MESLFFLQNFWLNESLSAGLSKVFLQKERRGKGTVEVGVNTGLGLMIFCSVFLFWCFISLLTWDHFRS